MLLMVLFARISKFSSSSSAQAADSAVTNGWHELDVSASRQSWNTIKRQQVDPEKQSQTMCLCKVYQPRMSPHCKHCHLTNNKIARCAIINSVTCKDLAGARHAAGD